MSGDETKLSCEVLVVGGGLAGVCAAISAARGGAKTILVHDRPVLGGNCSSECRVAPLGADSFNPWARESGLLAEIFLEDRWRSAFRMQNGHINSTWDLTLYDLCMREPNLQVILNTSARDVTMQGRRIKAVRCEQIGSETTITIEADIFIDCTGDGVLCAAAGAEVMYGRESREQFGESLAPEQPDDGVMGSSLLFLAEDVGRAVHFEAPPWAVKYESEQDLAFRKHNRPAGSAWAGYWWIEIGHPYHTIKDNEKIRHLLLSHLLGIWDHIKNAPGHDAENYAITWIGAVPAKRESRRIKGLVILRQRDVEEPTRWEDVVGYGGWFIDLHTPGGILKRYDPPEPVHGDENEKDKRLVSVYGIPYRALVPAGLENVLMAGRHISMTHVAMGTVRVMKTLATLGQAAGTAAAICINRALTPPQIYPGHIEDLQQRLLADDCYLPGIRSKDPRDIAPQATLSASSEATAYILPAETTVPLEAYNWANVVPHAGGDATAYVYLKNTGSGTAKIEVRLYRCEEISSPTAGKRIQLLKRADLAVPAGFKGKMAIPPLSGAYEEGFYLLEFGSTAAVEIFLGANEPVGTGSYRKRPHWQRRQYLHRPLACGLESATSPYPAQAVVSGVARPEKTPNCWVSGPGLPQWIELAWPEPVRVEQVWLTFDHGLNRPWHAAEPFALPAELVKDFNVQVRRAGGWQTVATVQRNRRRQVRIRLDEAEKISNLRIEVTATYGADGARIYEIRALSTG